MNKLKLFLLLIFFHLTLFSFELNTKIELSEKEKAFIKKHPQVTLTSGLSFEPFFITNEDNSISGHDREIIDLIEKRSGLKIDVKLGIWKEVQEKAKKREFDGLACGGYSKDREIYYNKSIPYLQFTTLVYIKKGNPKNIYKIEDLYGKKVAIQKGNSLFETLLRDNIKNSEKIEIIYYESISDLIKAIVSNEVDFTIYDETAFYVAKQIGLRNFIEGVFTLGEPFDVMFWLRKDWPELVTIINKGIKSINAKEKMEIRDRWFGNTQIAQKKLIELSEIEREYLKNKKEIKMCIDPNWMPLEKLKDGEHIGISSEFINLMQKNIPTNIMIVPTKDWSETLNFAKNRKCDIISLAMKTPSRQKYLNFTKPYLEIPLVLATNKNIPFVDDISLLKDKKIAIVKDFAFSELLKSKYSNLTIVEVQSVKDGLEQVRSGKVFGFADALATINYITKNEFMEDIKIVGRFNENFELSVAVRNDDINLLNIFEKLIENISESEKQVILNKWVSLKYEIGFDYKLFWKILIFILIIVSFIIYRHYILNRVNRELEAKIKEELEKSRKKDNLIFQQNKMASLGEMVGNIAHQWRQPLAQVSMIHNYLLSQLLDNKGISKDIIDEIHNGQRVLQFMSKTIDTFENFYNINSNDTKFNLIEAIDKVILILKEVIYLNKIEVIKEIKEDFAIEGELNAFTQVILSIIQNSVYFLKARDIKNPKITIAMKKKSDFIELSISDNGGGIKEEHLTHIFDYGFSKRDSNKNSTGIGLYIANLIIKEKFLGEIKVQNIKDGVNFQLFLPIYTHEKRQNL